MYCPFNSKVPIFSCIVNIYCVSGQGGVVAYHRIVGTRTIICPAVKVVVYFIPERPEALGSVGGYIAGYIYISNN